MNDKKINEEKENESELPANGILSEEGLENKIEDSSQKIVKRNERVNNNFTYRDLSGGLLGI